MFLTLVFMTCVASAALQTILVVDCGSSSSRMNIFQWDPENDVRFAQFLPPSSEEEDNLERYPDLAHLTPAEAAVQIRFLIDQAALYVPPGMQSETQLYVFATAGMRLLSDGDQAAIWEAVSAEAMQGPFDTKATRTLAGDMEAIYGWIAVNGLHGSLLTSQQTVGSMEIGGASWQASFVTTPILGNQVLVQLSKNEQTYTYRTYSNSYMRSGQEQALLRLLAKECGQSAVVCNSMCKMKDSTEVFDLSAYGGQQAVNVTGLGDWDKCHALVFSELLHLDYECLLPPCAMMGSYFPSRPTGSTTYAYTNFFYALNGVGAVGWNDQSSNIGDYGVYGRVWCSGNGRITGPEVEVGSFDSRNCFGSAYASSLLEAVGFTLPVDPSVIITRKINGQSVSWASGAALLIVEEIQLQQSCAAAKCCAPSDVAGCTGYESCVCAFDPFCCLTAWDAQCVSEAQGRCGLSC